MAKNEEKALTVVGDYAVMQHTTESLNEIIRANIGNSDLGPGDLDHITMPAGGGITWEIATLDGDISTKAFEGMIAAWKETRSHWKESYGSTGGNAPPDCSSDDCMTGVGDPGGDCGTCPFAQFGSAVNDAGEPTDGQACGQKRMLAIVIKDDLIPMLLIAPPTSLKGLRRYFLRLASRTTPYYGVVTRFSLKKIDTKPPYSVIEVSSAGKLEGEDLAKMAAYSQMIESSLERVRPQDREA